MLSNIEKLMNVMGCRNVTESDGTVRRKPPHFIGIGVSVARPLRYGSLQCPKPLAQMSEPPQCCAALLDLYDRIRFDSMCRRSAPSDHSQIASFALALDGAGGAGCNRTAVNACPR